MFLELTDTGSDTVPAFALAHLPWTLPLRENASESLGLRAMLAKDDFIRKTGYTRARFRLVLETREEWRDAIHDERFISALPSPQLADEKMLAAWLDVDDVCWPGPRGLTAMEQRVASELQRFVRDAEEATGGRPTAINLTDPTTIANVRRACQHVGLRIASPATTYKARTSQGIVDLG